jgi:hypothetical protein
MTEDFNKWWNTDRLVEDNPYTRDTPAFWAWEGWQAGAAAEREWQGLTDEELRMIVGVSSADSDWNVVAVLKWCRAIEAKLKEKNSA